MIESVGRCHECKRLGLLRHTGHRWLCKFCWAKTFKQ